MSITAQVRLVHGAAYEGMVADLQLANRISCLNGSPIVIPAGVTVQRETDGSVKQLTTGGKPVGILVRELVDVTDNPQGTLGLNPGKTGTVLTDGVIWVKASGAVAVGADVYSGVGSSNKGMYGSEAGSGVTEAIQIPNAKFIDGASEMGQLVRIKLTIGG